MAINNDIIIGFLVIYWFVSFVIQTCLINCTYRPQETENVINEIKNNIYRLSCNNKYTYHVFMTIYLFSMFTFGHMILTIIQIISVIFVNTYAYLKCIINFIIPFNDIYSLYKMPETNSDETNNAENKV